MTWFPWLRDKDGLECEGILMNKDIAFYESYNSLFIAEGAWKRIHGINVGLN